MFSGTVRITTAIKNPGIRFRSTEFDPKVSAVTTATMESTDGRELQVVIRVDGASTAHAVEDLAFQVYDLALSRLACAFDLVDSEPSIRVEDLRSNENPNGVILAARGTAMTMSLGSISVITDKSPDEVRQVLDKPPVKGDIYYKLFRQARKAGDHTVEFLGYYQIVSAVLGDPDQSVIDQFFIAHDETPPVLTPKPGRKPGTTESVYTRLRNEVAHVRVDPHTATPLDTSKTRSEIAQHVGRLRRLAAIAIQQAAG